MSGKYEVQVYVDHGFFSYDVSEMASALEHAHVIMESGVYRRSIGDKAVAFYRVKKVKVVGEGLASAYPDRFNRT